MNDKDHFRFVHDLFELNNQETVSNISFRFNQDPQFQKLNDKDGSREPRKLLVNIICWCLMPNHFHLVLEQLVDGGISLFMQKIGAGYTKYFNLKYERVGSLFQGTFKAIRIEEENYLLQLIRYFHLNPVSLIEPNWKESGIKDKKKVNQFLETYRWSSYMDYLGKKNFPSLINRQLVNSLFDSPADHREFVNSWLSEDLELIDDLVLEN
ncbi:MAG: transposase [Candidatus Aenigmarchaeota archaeon]|nr:transposase [Candidatus Aenigmarchaeota archaeon]